MFVCMYIYVQDDCYYAKTSYIFTFKKYIICFIFNIQYYKCNFWRILLNFIFKTTCNICHCLQKLWNNFHYNSRQTATIRRLNLPLWKVTGRGRESAVDLKIKQYVILVKHATLQHCDAAVLGCLPFP